MTNTLKNFTEEKEIFMNYNVKRELESIAKNMTHRKEANKLKTPEERVQFVAHVHDEFMKKHSKDAPQMGTAKLLLESPEIQEQILTTAALERGRFKSIPNEVVQKFGVDTADASAVMRKGTIALLDMTHHRTDHLDGLQASVKAYAAHYGIKNPGDAMMLSNSGNKYDKQFLTELRSLMDPYLTDRATKAFVAKATIEANKEQSKESGLQKLLAVFGKNEKITLDQKAVAEIDNMKNRLFDKGVRSMNLEEIKGIALRGATLQQDQIEKKAMDAAKTLGTMEKISNSIGNFLKENLLDLPSKEFVNATNLAHKAVAQIARTNTPQEQHSYGV